MSSRRGILLVLSAPSGAGKTTVVRRLLATVADLEFSISYTTRPARTNERDGVDYHFVSEDVFRTKIERDEFLEWAEVHGSLYATGRAETEAVCASGRDILLDVDVQGAEQVRRSTPDAVCIFMIPPSFGELARRLRKRGLDDPEDIENRLRRARTEATHYKDYDYIVINEDIERSVELLRSVLLAERARSKLLEAQVESILESFE